MQDGGSPYTWPEGCYGEVPDLPGNLFSWFHSYTFGSGVCDNHSIESDGGAYSWSHDSDVTKHQIGGTAYSRRSIYKSK